MIRSVLLASAIALGQCVTVSSCTSLDFSTVRQVEKLSPLTADPAGIALAAQMPEGVGIIPGKSILSFDMTRDDTGETDRLAVVLEVRGKVGGRQILAIPQDSYADLRAFQAKAREWQEAEGLGVSGSFSVEIEACYNGTLPPKDPRLSVDIRLGEGEPFLPLVKGYRLNNLDAEVRDAVLKSCDP